MLEQQVTSPTTAHETSGEAQHGREAVETLTHSLILFANMTYHPMGIA
jgi:hypothetical protein